MVLAAFLVAALASLASCSRLADQGQLQPSSEGSASQEMNLVSGSNSTDAAGADLPGDRCCCFVPYLDEYVADPKDWINVDHCPAVGCLEPIQSVDYFSQCSKAFLNKADIYCEVTSIVGCNGLVSGIKEKVDPKWLECYRLGREKDECMHLAIKLH
mmetsp:Transcript_45833/g.84051  ORF Transcript_45833/g.84051 Transcript_45833/m.84051 type:complete len:157 (+) Transcript_45833:81-551(+)